MKFAGPIPLILILMSLSGCNTSQIPQHFDDQIWDSKSTKKFQTVTGWKGIYVLHGDFKTLNLKVGAGELLCTQGAVRKEPFVISELLAKFPEFATEESRAEASKQDAVIKKLEARSGKH